MFAMRKFLFSLMAAFALFSCSRPEVVYVDVETAQPIEIDTARLLPLKTTDSSMLYDINSIMITPQTVIVHSRDYVRVFDGATGKFRNNIATRGDAENEFTYIGNIWLEDSTVRIFEPNKAAILTFRQDGSYVGAEKPFPDDEIPGQRPREYIELPGVGFYSTNFSTDHTTENNPKYTFYKEKGKFGKAVPGREMKEPTHLVDGVWVDTINKRLLTWEPLRDTIFEVTENMVRPVYYIDFGKRSLPTEVQNLPYLSDRVDVFNSRRDKPYASLVRYLQLAEGYMFFSFACGNEMNYLVSYNPANRDTKVFRVASDDGAFSQTTFFKISEGYVYLEIRNRKDAFSNPLLYKIPLEKLK